MHHLRALLSSGSIAAVLLAIPALASAVMPTGSFEIQFGGRQSIWMGDEGEDPEEQLCAEFLSEFDELEYCDFQAYVDAKGKFHGFFEFAGWIDGLHFAEGGPIKGSQKGDDRSGITRISFSIKLTGIASDGTHSASTKSSIRYSGQITADGLATGVWEQSVCINGFGCNEEQSTALPEILTNGGWSLAIDLVDGGGGALGGTAWVGFGDGSECSYAVRGKYSAKKDVASLSLVPIDCPGTSIRMKDVHLSSGPFDDLSGSIAYKLFGFTGATPFGDLPGLAPQIALENHSSNQQLFAFICNGTLILAASVDPGACSWSASITAVSLPPPLELP